VEDRPLDQRAEADQQTLIRRLCVLNRPWLGLLAAIFLTPAAQAQSPGNRYINPPSLVKPTGYTHVVVAADRHTVYIAGQVAFDSTGKVVGEGDFKAQAEQVYGNLRKALAGAGATFANLVKTTTLVTDVKNVQVLREIRNRYLDTRNPPANTLIVATLARPELLLEIEAVAVIP
jgi:enamine deaminase RidA (YjgF/YER057c/UK114 family)